MRRYLPFLLLLFVVAALLRVDFFFTIAYLFFLLYVLGRMWARRSLDQVRFGRQFTRRAFAGDEVAVRLRVSNAGRLPVPWLQVHESLPVALTAPPFHREVLSLRAGEQRDLHYTLYCRKRGVYPLGPLQADTSDLLGIQPPLQAELRPEHLIVYPHVVRLPRLRLPTRSPLVALPARTPLFEDPARLTGVRDYLPGDSQRRIHWTATASAGRLLVKQYQPAIARETVLCLDLHTEGYDLRRRADASELAIVVAASLAHHILTYERLPVGLAMEGEDSLLGAPARVFLPPGSERGHLMGVLEALARAGLSNRTPLPDVLRRARARLAWGTTVVAITGSAAAEVFDALAALRQAGFAVALVLVQAAPLPEAAAKRAALLGIAVRQVWREADLEQWQ